MKKRIREGYSLIELLIVIAIMAILVGGVALSLALLRSADTQGLASAIDSSLTDLKTYSESRRGPIYLYIYKGEKNFYAHYGFSKPDGTPQDKPEDFSVPSDPGDDEVLGSSVLRVKYDGIEIKDDVFCVVQIRKKDGAYVDVSSGGFSQSTPKNFEICSSGGEAKYKVFLAKETGLHYFDIA